MSLFGFSKLENARRQNGLPETCKAATVDYFYSRRWAKGGVYLSSSVLGSRSHWSGTGGAIPKAGGGFVVSELDRSVMGSYSMLQRCVVTMFITIALTGCVVSLVQPEEDRIAYLEAHEGLDPEVERAIGRGKVTPGMSREQVEACWGSPSAIDNSESLGLNLEWGEEVWKYRSDDMFIVHPEATVTFRNGKVVDVSPTYLSDLED
jgi:hypothetical protein